MSRKSDEAAEDRREERADEQRERAAEDREAVKAAEAEHDAEVAKAAEAVKAAKVKAADEAKVKAAEPPFAEYPKMLYVGAARHQMVVQNAEEEARVLAEYDDTPRGKR